MEITRPHTQEIVTHHLVFSLIGDPTDSGWMFDCDKDGNVDLSNRSPLAVENYHRAQEGVAAGLYRRELERYVHVHRPWAHGPCDRCGQQVILDAAAVTCKCGASYNWAGQRLRDNYSEESDWDGVEEE